MVGTSKQFVISVLDHCLIVGLANRLAFER
jgi:hypothetical protein